MRKMTGNSQPDAEELYRLPEVCRELAEAGVNAGLARSPQEYWTYTVGPKAPEADEGPTALELIVAGVINAHPSRNDDARTPQQRFNEAMDALLGGYYRTGLNDRDDRNLLAHMACAADAARQDDVAPQLRAFARAALTEIEGPQSVNESSIRRLVRKFEEDEDAAEGYARAPDDFRQLSQSRVVREIAALLRSVGTAVKLPEGERSHLSM